MRQDTRLDGYVKKFKGKTGKRLADKLAFILEYPRDNSRSRFVKSFLYDERKWDENRENLLFIRKESLDSA